MTADFFSEKDCDQKVHRRTDDSGMEITDCISLERANRLLRERSKVVSCKNVFGGLWDERIAGYDPKGATHTALLINVQLIPRDSAEKIVERLAEMNVSNSLWLNELIDRARALKAGGK